MQRPVDGCSYSGALTVTAAATKYDDGDVLVFGESELLGCLVLTVGEAEELSTALANAPAS
jgi:hypothetical protein